MTVCNGSLFTIETISGVGGGRGGGRRRRRRDSNSVQLDQ